MARIDELAPNYMGEDRLQLSVDPISRLVAGRWVTILIDYSSVGPSGVVAPIVAEAVSARGRGFARRVFERPPSSFTFKASVPGQWLIRVGESAHNRWQGRLLLTALGDEHDYVEGIERPEGEPFAGALPNPYPSGSGLPAGFVYIVDEDGAYLLDEDGAYLVE